MAELFDVNPPTISKHLSNIFEEGELNIMSTVSKMEIVQTEGNRKIKRKVDFYNLYAIISVGVSRKFTKSDKFPYLGNERFKRIHDQGFAMDDNDWRRFVQERKEEDLSALIAYEKLKDEETRRFIDNVFRDGTLKTAGTDIDKILPPVSCFGSRRPFCQEAGHY